MAEKRKKASVEERYINLKDKMDKTRKELQKKKRAERNKLINDTGKLFVEECNYSNLEDYKKLCSSKEFKALVSAYDNGEFVVTAESNISAENAADNMPAAEI